MARRPLQPARLEDQEAELPLWAAHEACAAVQPTRATQVRYALDMPLQEDERKLATLALSFLGVGALPPERLADSASWDRTGAPTLVGGREILRRQVGLKPPVSLAVTQIVAQGKTATVSGRLTRNGQPPALFCHVLRFTDPSQARIAQVVSFEQVETA